MKHILLITTLIAGLVGTTASAASAEKDPDGEYCDEGPGYLYCEWDDGTWVACDDFGDGGVVCFDETSISEDDPANAPPSSQEPQSTSGLPDSGAPGTVSSYCWTDGSQTGCDYDNGDWFVCDEFDDGFSICLYSSGKIETYDPAPEPAD